MKTLKNGARLSPPDYPPEREVSKRMVAKGPTSQLLVLITIVFPQPSAPGGSILTSLFFPSSWPMVFLPGGELEESVRGIVN